MSSWDSVMDYAKGLLQDAKEYSNMNAKAKTLKMAWNAVYGLPDNYPQRANMLHTIEMYAYSCGIDLDEVTGYQSLGNKSMRQIVQGKVEEIIRWTKKYGNPMRYSMVMDLLCDKDEGLTQSELDEAWKVLNEHGVIILREKDEGYEAGKIDQDIFIPADVNIGQKPLNVYNLMERLENDEIDLEPEYQRHGNLWSMDQQSRLIESMMLKIPIPAFYFNAANEEKWGVIDGLQRLTVLKNFLVGQSDEDGKRKKEKFIGLQYLSEFNGCTFDELPRQYVRRIKETSIVAYTVEKGTPDAVIYNIFQRINTGGLKLNPQEIRQALYTGKATQLIQQLAESDEFLQATQYAIPPERMTDREYVTRFIGK